MMIEIGSYSFLRNPHFTDPTLRKRALQNAQSTEPHFTEAHISEPHILEPHITDRILRKRTLRKRNSRNLTYVSRNFQIFVAFDGKAIETLVYFNLRWSHDMNRTVQ